MSMLVPIEAHVRLLLVNNNKGGITSHLIPFARYHAVQLIAFDKGCFYLTKTFAKKPENVAISQILLNINS